MDITTLDINGLKALAYDMIAKMEYFNNEIEKVKQDLQVVNNRINQLNTPVPPETPPVEDEVAELTETPSEELTPEQAPES